MKVKLKNVIFINGFIPALQKLMQKEMSPASAYILGKFSAEVDKNGVSFSKAHEKLIKKYARKKKDGSPKMLDSTRYDIPKGKLDAFNKEFEEVIEIEEEYELMKKVGLGEDEKLTPRDAFLLEDILDIEIED